MTPPPGTPVWAYSTPTDLRKGFNGLVGIVAHHFRLDVLDGGCFLFVNVTRTSAKLLYWDGTGLCLLAKRLAKGKFPSLTVQRGATHLRLTDRELNAFFHGFKVEYPATVPGSSKDDGIA